MRTGLLINRAVPLGFFAATLVCCASTPGLILTRKPANSDSDRIFALAEQKYRSSSSKLSHTYYPDLTDSSLQWHATSAGAWTSGFYPGVLWAIYKHTHDGFWKELART